MRKLLTLTGVLALLAVGSAGCGDSKPDPRVAFVKTTNQIQIDMGERIADAGRELSSSSSRAEGEAALHVQADAMRRAAGRLTRLKRPAGTGRPMGRLIRDLEDFANKADQAASEDPQSFAAEAKIAASAVSTDIDALNSALKSA